MSQKQKQAIQVVVSLVLALWIFWFLYKDIEFDSLSTQVRDSKWSWIFASLFIALVGFWLRAWRWTLLITKDEGKVVSVSRAFHALMVGYLTNLLIPRAGEVARCGMLNRSNGVSLGHLLGTVILERTVDLAFLIGTIALAFFVERSRFIDLSGQLINVDQLIESSLDNMPIIVGGFFIFLFFIYFLFRRFQDHRLINKAQHFFREIWTGLKTIGTLKNPIGFWTSSLALWIIYFFTMYFVAFAIESTANLSPGEVLLVMVMGSIGMVAPVQGGIGTFHALVAFILIQFGITEQDGKIFAAIIHGTQMLLMIVVGLISWFWMVRIKPWSKPPIA